MEEIEDIEMEYCDDGGDAVGELKPSILPSERFFWEENVLFVIFISCYKSELVSLESC